MRNVARRSWDTEPPFVGDVMVTIVYLYEDVPLDVDNVPKPILDALKGLVYSDDAQVTDLICRKRHLRSASGIQYISSMLGESQLEDEPFLHIIVETAPTQETAE